MVPAGQATVASMAGEPEPIVTLRGWAAAATGMQRAGERTLEGAVELTEGVEAEQHLRSSRWQEGERARRS